MYYIQINNGDEYRAKIEGYKIEKEKEGDENRESESQETFFGGIYDSAMDITKEIIMEMKEYSKKAKNGQYNAKYQGMGNNIVAFCAERGQGKTSAMQSFSNILKEDAKKEYYKRECRGVDFEVLDSIDPSSLDKGESIVRVLLSRIFDKMVTKLEELDKSERFYDYRREPDFIKKNREIFPLFQECYENIDYLRKEKGVEQNSLEKLAQLGSSARLKSNLHELIQKYMEITDKNNNCESYKCLVIQIDDADLAVNNVFQICEDIRNYFSIPNVLVFMAANFTQLREAIHQWYLKQYDFMIKLQSVEFADECSLMAARYMEKMIPVGHRIVLPDIERIIKEEFQAIKIKYKRKMVSFDFNDKLCYDMQDQLLKALYQKTGIILLKEKGKLHSFLPHTLRELTHFVKMLSEMKSIDHKKVFQPNIKNNDKSGISNLQSNISMIKGYFLEYWCHSHIKKYDYQKLMDKIGSLNQQLPLIYKNIVNCFKVDMDKNTERITCYDIFNILVGGLETEKEPGALLGIQDALRLYATIMLNEWFVKVAEDMDSGTDMEQISGLVKSVGKIIDVSELYNDGIIKGYQFLKFTFSVDNLLKYLGSKKDSDEIKGWFRDYYNSDIFLEKNNESPVILENEKLVWNKKFNEAEFDFFQTLLLIILRYWKDASREKGGVLSGQDSSEDNNPCETSNDEKISSNLVMARNIIANYDVHKRIKDKINVICRNLEQQNIKLFSSIYMDFYDAVDSVVNNDAQYLEEYGSLKNIFKDSREMENIRIQALMLSNEENYNQYINDYKEYLEKTISNTLELLYSYKQDVKGDEYLVKLKVPKFFGIVDADIIDLRINKLKEIDNSIHEEIEELHKKVAIILEDAGERPEDVDMADSGDVNKRIMECVGQSKKKLGEINQDFNKLLPGINGRRYNAPGKRKS